MSFRSVYSWKAASIVATCVSASSAQYCLPRICYVGAHCCPQPGSSSWRCRQYVRRRRGGGRSQSPEKGIFTTGVHSRYAALSTSSPITASRVRSLYAVVVAMMAGEEEDEGRHGRQFAFSLSSSAMDIFNRPPAISEDRLQYALYPAPGQRDRTSVSSLAAVLQAHVDDVLQPSFVWHRDAFQLKVAPDPDGAKEEYILEGTMRVGDCVDDEWCVVWLLREISRKWDVIIRYVF
jgi:hypothetical protein